MHDEVRVPDWSESSIPHGFAGHSREVARGFHLVRVRQVHGATCLAADESTTSPAGDADALVTDRRGVAVAIATADCVPVLLAAPEARAVAAVHAGWRGTVASIAAVGVRALVERGARSSSARLSRRSRRRATSATFAPAIASARASSTPSPADAPVMSATLPRREKRSSSVCMTPG